MGLGSIVKLIGFLALLTLVASLIITLAPYVAQAYNYGVNAIGSLYSFPAIFPAIWNIMSGPFTTFCFAVLGVGLFATAVTALLRRF